MAGISDVAKEFDAFAQYLPTRRRDMVEAIAALNNGFEGWIKLEFYLWLTSQRELRGLGSGGAADVGLEYKVQLDQRHSEMDREHKQCDIWIRDQSDKYYHYVEIKAPFANANAGKMLTSAGNDFWYMSRIRHTYEQAASGNAIVLGVGFSDSQWQVALDRVRYQASLPEDTELSGEGSLDREGRVRWGALTRVFRS